MINNNLNPDASRLRDTFLKAEKNYVSEIIDRTDIKEKINLLNETINADILFDMARSIVDDIEIGIIPEGKTMEEVEEGLIVILAAIRDVTLRRKLVLGPDYEEEEELSQGRGR